MKRYGIFKPGRREAFCYIASKSASSAMRYARKLFTLPRGTIVVEIEQ